MEGLIGEHSNFVIMICVHMWQDESRKVENLLSKRAALQQKKADLERKIRDLGTLPADAFDKYRDQPLKMLHSLLHKAQQELKKYG